MREALHFGRMARAYRWLEYASFGGALERCRFYFLPQISNARRILTLGEGDGRFVTRLLESSPRATVDAVDSSMEMLQVLSERVRAVGAGERLRVRQFNIRDFTPDSGDYDLVATHFFLDCLSENEIADLLKRVAPHLTEDARWLVSEFAIAPAGWRRIFQRPIVAALYMAFGWITNLQARRLPEIRRVLQSAGFTSETKQEFLGGLIYSELWKRKNIPPAS